METTQMTQAEAVPSTTYAGLAADDVGRSDERAPLVFLHGLTFDRTMWRPTLAELETLDPGRRAITLDLPGHGESPDASSYSLEVTVERVRAAIADAGLHDPILVGHSASSSVAAMYATQHPTSGIVLVEGTFLVAGFAEMLRSMEPVLRGPGFGAAWSRISEYAFRLDQMAPDVRSFVEATSRPRQYVVLGYWQDLFARTPAELQAWLDEGAATMRQSGLPVTSVVGQEPSADEAAWLETSLPAARTLVWPGSGHFPHLAHPRAFAELLAPMGVSTDAAVVAIGR
jgi:pimeloyl-ACP methyl ester carboxylesterase